MMAFDTEFSEHVAETLPGLRRYARALTGSQPSGDAFAAAALEALLHDQGIRSARSARRSLFRVFHLIWTSAGSPVEAAAERLERRVQDRLEGLAPNAREALLLQSLEAFATDEIADILGADPDEAEEMIAIARHEMEAATKGKVLVIEDEPIVAMDIHGIVSGMGHTVVGMSRTHRDALALGLDERPHLILADVQLADGSSGIEAVQELMAEVGDIPVIFVTAFPERLLTGERPEPTFLISKPYREEQLRAAIGQAMFFASTDMPAGS